MSQNQAHSMTEIMGRLQKIQLEIQVKHPRMKIKNMYFVNE